MSRDIYAKEPSLFFRYHLSSYLKNFFTCFYPSRPSHEKTVHKKFHPIIFPNSSRFNHPQDTHNPPFFQMTLFPNNITPATKFHRHKGSYNEKVLHTASTIYAFLLNLFDLSYT